MPRDASSSVLNACPERRWTSATPTSGVSADDSSAAYVAAPFCAARIRSTSSGSGSAVAFGASLSTAVRDSVGRASCASHAMIRLAAARQSRPRPVNIASLPSAASMSPARAGANTDSLVRNLRRNAAIDFDDRAIHGSISSRSLRAAVASARVKWSSRRDRSRSSSTHCPWKFTFSVSSTSVRIRVSRLCVPIPRAASPRWKGV